MRRTRWYLWTVAAASVLLLTACGGGDNDKIKLGMAVEKDASNMAFVVAHEQGIFEDCGLDVDLVYFQGGGALVPPLAVGEVDFGWVGNTTVLSAVEEGAPIRTIGEINQTAAGWGVVVPKDSSIRTIGDLKPGVKVSYTSEGSLSHWFALWSADQAGLSADDITGVPLGGSVPAIGSALKKGDVDAAVVLLPWGQLLEKQGMRWVSKFDEELPDLSYTGLHASERTLEDSDDASKMLGAYVKAVEWLKENREEAESFIAEFYEVEPALAATIYDLVVPDYNPTGEFATDDMDYLIDTVAKIPGFIDGNVDASSVLESIEPADC